MEKGFTPQLTKSVTPTPRQCWRTFPNEPKSILSSMGMIINHTSTATGRLTLATSANEMARKTPGKAEPSATPATMHSATQRVR